MAAKKHARKANPKRRSGGRKNPIYAVNAKTGKQMQFFKDSEITGIQKRAKELADGMLLSAPSKYSAAEKALIGSVAGNYYLPGKSVTKKSIDALVKKIDADSKFVDPSSRTVLTKVKNRLKTILAQQSGIASTRAKNAPSIKQLGQIAKDVKAKRSAAAMKKYPLKNIKVEADYDYSTTDLQDLLRIAQNMKSGNPSGGMKMAASKKKKSKAKKAPARKKKKAGKKVVRRKVKAKAAPKKRRKSRRKAKIAMTAQSVKELGKKAKSARKSLRRKKKGAMSRKYKAKVQFKKLRNPTIAESAMSIAKIAAAGAAAGVALQLANRMVKPMIDKLVPRMIADLKIGNAPVGQIAISCLVPGLLAAGLRMVKHPMAQQVSDVIIVTTAANAGQRLVAGLLPAGMAGVEPVLMGVEPLLMGEADFGDADFGAIEQFSGVEPMLMGSSADFGAIEQFSGHDAASLGAIQLHGDEDYAGEDDMDGESEFGLG